MVGEHQGNGVGSESLLINRRVLWYLLVLGVCQSAVTLVGLLKASNQDLPVALFLFAPTCVSFSISIFRAYPDALYWWGLRLVLLGFSMSLLAAIYFFVGELLLPSLVPYGTQMPALTVIFTGVAVTASGLELFGSVVALGESAWSHGRRRRAEAMD